MAPRRRFPSKVDFRQSRLFSKTNWIDGRTERGGLPPPPEHPGQPLRGYGRLRPGPHGYAKTCATRNTDARAVEVFFR